MVTQSPHRGAIILAAVFVLASIALSLFVWRSLGGPVPLSPKGYEFHATFSNASQLEPNAAVRIAGVDVGRVVAVAPSGLRTDATIRMDSRYAPLPADTRGILRQKTLLGETFVELTPGSRSAPKLAEGGRLSPANVAPTQPLDRVLGVLDDATRRDVQALFSNGATALRGRGSDVNDALGQLDPLTTDFAAMLAILDRQRRPVGSLVRDAGTLLNTVGDHQASLRALITSADAVFGATASRNRALTATVRELGPLVARLRATSGAVITTSRLAAPTLHRLRPAAPLVAPALRAVNTLAPEVEGVLGELDRALPVARRALPAAARLVGELDPFIRVVYPATREITPIIDLVRAYRRELVSTMANVGAALEGTSPGAGGRQIHYLRALVPMDEESIVGYAKRLPSNRHNAYFAPGGLAQLGKGGLLASDCRNTANAQIVPVFGTGAPACHQQPPWTFEGLTRYFPHVQRMPAKRGAR
jgi:virulence factor Mce-like protein